MIDLDKHKLKADKQANENKVFLAKLNRKPPRDLDLQAQQLHHEAFEHINCLECANCCKSISPIIIDRDVDRIAKFLRMKPSDLIDEYLHLDTDGDYVFRQSPCPFLMADNYCRIYDVRPRACREYPHTDRRRFHQISKLTWKNTFICPAALEVVEKLKINYKGAL